MGIDYSAAIFVGLHRSELEDHENFEDFENGDLDQAPPFYDGGQAAIFGVSVVHSGDYSASEIEGSLDAKIQAAKDSFKETTGRDGKVYITTIGY